MVQTQFAGYMWKSEVKNEMKIFEFMNKMKENEKIMIVMKGIAMGAMLIAIFLHLLNADLTSAPEFIYSQF